MGPHERGAERLRLGDEPVAHGVVDREALLPAVLVVADAAEAHRAAVDVEPPVRDADRAHPAVQPVGADLALALPPPRPRGERHVIEVRPPRGPEPRLLQYEARREADRRPGGDPPRAERQRALPEAPAHGDALLAPGGVAHERRHLHLRVAPAAGERGAHDHLLEVGRVDPAQVDLPDDAAVVPPAAGGHAARRLPVGREVRSLAARVDADDQAVRAAPREPLQDELEGQVGTGVGADLAAVEPHGRAVVHGLEAHHPLQRRVSVRQLEVPPVPADRAAHRGRAVVARVPGVRHGRGRPALCRGGHRQPVLDAGVRRVEPEQPRAVEQEATRVAVGVQRPLRRRLRRARRGRGEEEDRREGDQAERQASHHGDCQHRARRQKSEAGGKRAKPAAKSRPVSSRRRGRSGPTRPAARRPRRSAAPPGAPARTAPRGGRRPPATRRAPSPPGA